MAITIDMHGPALHKYLGSCTHACTHIHACARTHTQTQRETGTHTRTHARTSTPNRSALWPCGTTILGVEEEKTQLTSQTKLRRGRLRGKLSVGVCHVAPRERPANTLPISSSSGRSNYKFRGVHGLYNLHTQDIRLFPQMKFNLCCQP